MLRVSKRTKIIGAAAIGLATTIGLSIRGCGGGIEPPMQVAATSSLPADTPRDALVFGPPHTTPAGGTVEETPSKGAHISFPDAVESLVSVPPGTQLTMPDAGGTLKIHKGSKDVTAVVRVKATADVPFPAGTAIAYGNGGTSTLQKPTTVTVDPADAATLPKGKSTVPLPGGATVTVSGGPLNVTVPGASAALVPGGWKIKLPEDVKVTPVTKRTPPTPPAPPAPPAVPIPRVHGEWSSLGPGWGAIHITQRGGNITGTYEHDDGRIIGAYDRDTKRWNFTWTEELKPGQDPRSQSGDGYFTVSEDGRTMKTKWRWMDETDYSRGGTAIKLR